mmetsp:Transcript_19496/g.35352  ORF Transcript_19496/g.35352 Transcript_19496/m.35352 type:complete len:287 (-) Transcript_19496:258-1118(-)
MGQCAGRPIARTGSSSTVLGGNPTSSLVPPGMCVFNEEWSSAKLISKEPVGVSSRVFVFELADQTKPLGLSTCACLLAKGPMNEDGTPVVRPYTPISTNALVGKFELLVKVYPDGKMGQHLANLPLGQPVEFKHIEFNVKLQYPFKAKKIGIICGGTGVAPMIQALHALLGTAEDTTEVSMLYGSQLENDILAKDTLDAWATAGKERFALTHVLSGEPEGSSWVGARGHVDEALVKANMPSPDDDCLIFVCGPAPMYDALCGPRTDKELTGLLASLGFSADQVVKF